MVASFRHRGGASGVPGGGRAARSPGASGARRLPVRGMDCAFSAGRPRP
jgi:hypothetical protein